MKVFKHVRDNSGISKQGVVRGMKGDPSRMTVLNILDELEYEGWIIARKDKPNSQIYKLYANDANLLVSLDRELDELENAFMQLSYRLKEVYEDGMRYIQKSFGERISSIDDRIRVRRSEYTKMWKTGKELEKIYSLLDDYNLVFIKPYAPNPNMPEPELRPIPEVVQKTLLDSVDSLKSCFERVRGFRVAFCQELVHWVFRAIQTVYNTRTTDVWPMQIQDEQTLAKVYTAVYNRISKIQLLLPKYSVLKITVDQPDALILTNKGDEDESLQRPFDTILTSAIYVQLGMRAEIEAIAKCICKAHHHLIKYDYPSGEFVDWKILLRNIKLHDTMMANSNI
jgi:hypothetical protein